MSIRHHLPQTVQGRVQIMHSLPFPRIYLQAQILQFTFIHTPVGKARTRLARSMSRSLASAGTGAHLAERRAGADGAAAPADRGRVRLLLLKTMVWVEAALGQVTVRLLVVVFVESHHIDLVLARHVFFALHGHLCN